MSKNIDEIENIFPSGIVNNTLPRNALPRPFHGFELARDMLKQALIDKKLVQPMGVEQIENVLMRFYGATSPDDDMPKRISEAIFEAQFGDGK